MEWLIWGGRLQHMLLINRTLSCVGVDVNIVIVLSVNWPLLWLAHLAFSAMEVKWLIMQIDSCDNVSSSTWKTGWQFADMLTWKKSQISHGFNAWALTCLLIHWICIFKSHLPTKSHSRPYSRWPETGKDRMEGKRAREREKESVGVRERKPSNKSGWCNLMEHYIRMGSVLSK